jgi:hypothetical protein
MGKKEHNNQWVGRNFAGNARVKNDYRACPQVLGGLPCLGR